MASKGKFAKKDAAAAPSPQKKEEPKKEEPAPAPAAAPKKPIGNVFQLFPQSQIQEFKECFGLLDANRDGHIDADDLIAMYNNIGQQVNKKDAEAMLKECPGQLNFTAFLTLFGEKMHGSDSETALLSAFEMFDPDRKGTISEAYLKELLTEVGDQYSDSEVKQMWKELPVGGGNVDYKKYVVLVKRGGQEAE